MRILIRSHSEYDQWLTMLGGTLSHKTNTTQEQISCINAAAKISSGSTTSHCDISLPDYEALYFDDDHIKEISSGSPTTHSDISLPDYEAFYFDDDHIKEISSGSTTTYSDISLSEYDSFIFDLTHEEFVYELAHIISPPEYDCFYFKDLSDLGELMSVLNSEIRENFSTTLV
nr:hypothetical protein [Tanacetum cinerariifolium]